MSAAKAEFQKSVAVIRRGLRNNGIAPGRDGKFSTIEISDAIYGLDGLERKAKIAELKYFGDLSVEETAEALSVSTATVVREWRLTRAWLHRELTNAEAAT